MTRLRWDMRNGRQSSFALVESEKSAFSKRIRRANERYENKLKGAALLARVNKWLGADRTYKDLCFASGCNYRSLNSCIRLMAETGTRFADFDRLDGFLNGQGIT